MKTKLYLISAFIMITYAFCSDKADAGPDIIDNATNEDSIFTYHPIVPALINRETNPILLIRARIAGNEIKKCTQISLTLKGTSNLQIIKSVSVFYTGTSNKFSAAGIFSKTEKPEKTILFNGEQVLNKGDNYFWISFTLNEKTDLSDKVDAECEYVILNNEKKLIPTALSSNYQSRIGIGLRQHGDEGVNTYRIPGLATTNKGTLIAVYDVRHNNAGDLQGDIDIGMSRSTDGGRIWEPMKVILDMGEWSGKPQVENGVGDPSVLVDRERNTIWVAALWAHGHPEEHTWRASKPGILPAETGQLLLVRSDDDGLTWSEPINITSHIKDPKWYLVLQGPGNGITKSDGTLIFPAQFKDEQQIPFSTILYSKDHGDSWQIGTGAKPNTTEAQVIELDNGSLMLNMRDNDRGFRSVYMSKDLGKTWVKHPTSRSALIEPTCNASLIKGIFDINGEKKKILLFANPNSDKERNHMTIKISMDDGMTWPKQYWLLLDEGKGRGYPSMTQIDEKTFGILYEGSQADLVFEKVWIEEIIEIKK